MAKVGISTVQPGQATELERTVAAGSPVQDLKQKVPQAEPSAGFDELIDPNIGAPETAEIASAVEEGTIAGIEAEEAAQAQREAERIQPVGERFRDTGRIDKWNLKETKENAQPDGGIWNRAHKMASDYESGKIGLSVKPSGDAFKAAQEADTEAITPTIIEKAPEGSIISAVNKAGAVFNERTETNNIVSKIDPKYYKWVH